MGLNCFKSKKKTKDTSPYGENSKQSTNRTRSSRKSSHKQSTTNNSQNQKIFKNEPIQTSIGALQIPDSRNANFNNKTKNQNKTISTSAQADLSAETKIKKSYSNNEETVIQSVEVKTIKNYHEVKRTISNKHDLNREVVPYDDIENQMLDILEKSKALKKLTDNFWGPLDKVSELENKIRTLIMKLEHLEKTSDIVEAKAILEKSFKLLQDRIPLIEDYENEEKHKKQKKQKTTAEDNETKTEEIETKIEGATKILLQVVRLQRTIETEPVTQKLKNIYLGQLTKWCSDLDALEIYPEMKEAHEIYRDVSVFINSVQKLLTNLVNI